MQVRGSWREILLVHASTVLYPAVSPNRYGPTPQSRRPGMPAHTGRGV